MTESLGEVSKVSRIKWTPWEAPSVKKISSIEGAETLSYLLM